MIGTIIGAIALFGVICGVYYAGLKAGESKKSSEESASVAEPVEAVETPEVKEAETFELSLADIPDYNGKTFVEINNNEPCFDERDINTESFERYSGLDKLGRCGVAYANLSKDTMPVGERGNISEVKPAGWHSDSYDFIEGGNLYNRCHLIAFALSAENANERNLITGTRYMN
ncbi:MAG: DNA/RNA non-specific endonuclease, partial [Lachnospiraceae bacterium]|nr:DNA/RNA non-specific endonuclease [Lachnospiraceae bacterium]